MLIRMKPDATEDDIESVGDRVRELGYVPHLIPGATRVSICISGNQGAIDPDLFARFPSIAEAVPVSRPFKLASREVMPDDTVIRVPAPEPVEIGGGAFAVMAGLCSVEGQFAAVMESVRAIAAVLGMTV